MKKIKLWWSDDNHKLKTFGIIYVLIFCINWLQLTEVSHEINNNYLIFSHAFWHLFNGQPLYIAYPQEYDDFFFYHPVFAFLFAPFAVLPQLLGMFIWVASITALFFNAAIKMPFKKGFLWVFLILIIFELTKNLRHVQPNILNCSLMLFTFLSFEKKRNILAAFLCTLLFCIKGYGVIVGTMCFFYPKPWRTIAYGSLFLVLLSMVPLSMVSFSTLMQHYSDWISAISSDTILEPYCIMGFAERTLHWAHSESYIIGFGLLLFTFYWLILVLQSSILTLEDRAVFFGFLLMWIVAFNRAAESPTYLYAAVGSLIVYHFGKPNKIWTIVFGLCFYVITILASDLSPVFLKNIDRQYFLRPLFLLPMLFFAFYKGIKKNC